ncbi:MAG TPA: TonB-dependent receptor [Flavobacterium sp.]
MKYSIIASILLFAGIDTALAQKKDENIGTEVVNVVKPYTPTISDAFKVKETPSLEDEDNTKKEAIKYTIFSFPVASTFTPAKGRAAGVDPEAQERLYKNYLTLGIGNYFNANAELFVTENIGESGYVGGMLRHLSSAGGIDDIVLDDKFMNTSVDLTYGNKQQTYSWTADLGYQHQIYNWYGVEQDYFEDGVDWDAVDPQHTYHHFYIGGKIDVSESIFNEASLKFNHFSDSFGSAESRLYIKPSVGFDVSGTSIKADFIVDYVGGSFENDYDDVFSIKYGYTNFGVHPSFVINRDAWTINLGAAAFYSLNTENSDNKFFIYPQINASLKVVGDLMIFYTGAEGSLDQNSYRDFTNENPFVSPTLFVAPTDRQYDIFAGLKGKLANAVSYNVRGSYKAEKNKPMFRNNIAPAPALFDNDLEGYQYGNSFGVVYDNVKTLRFFGEVKADFSKNVSFGINGTFNSYNTEFQLEAWNLPSIQIGSSLDVNITKKWYAGADVFFVGERKDFKEYVAFENPRVATLDSYFDANAHVGYKHNDRLTGFLKFNNIANQAYEKWLDYPVQSFQVLLGASYKFDF